MIRLLSIVLVMTLLLGCAAKPLASGDFVAIDQSENAYAVYTGVPKKSLDAVAERIANAQGEISLVAWDTFSQNMQKYIKDHIIKNDYPDSKAVAGVAALVKKYPKTPIGLTWNGGIAITYYDYQHSKRTHKQYKANPGEYERTREKNPKADPVNPKGHLGPLLGW